MTVDTGGPPPEENARDVVPEEQRLFSEEHAPPFAGREGPEPPARTAMEPGSADARSRPEEEPEASAPPEDAVAPSEDAPANAPEDAPGEAAVPPEDAPEEAVVPPRLLGVRLRKAGQVLFFQDQTHTVRMGTKVLVETEQGQGLGAVEAICHGLTLPAGQGNCRILGLATAQDIALQAENAILAAEASAFCKTCIRQRSLEMKLVDVEVLHDRSKIIFYFTAPSRIDFRELVKDLVRNYRTRIELRQIGVRHEAQMIGGLGNCGSVCCCHTYLRKFAPVTIKMAKEQNLFLNPSKLSGMCGRLLCCLSFEQNNYEEFNRRCPKLGKKYETSQGTVRVLRANMFSQSIVIQNDAGEESELSLEEWEARTPHRADPPATDPHRSAAPRGQEGSRKNRPRPGQPERRPLPAPPGAQADPARPQAVPPGAQALQSRTDGEETPGDHPAGRPERRPRKRRRPHDDS